MSQEFMNHHKLYSHKFMKIFFMVVATIGDKNYYLVLHCIVAWLKSLQIIKQWNCRLYFNIQIIRNFLSFLIYKNNFDCSSLSIIRYILEKIIWCVGKRTIQHKDFHSLAYPAIGSVRFRCINTLYLFLKTRFE